MSNVKNRMSDFRRVSPGNRTAKFTSSSNLSEKSWDSRPRPGGISSRSPNTGGIFSHLDLFKAQQERKLRPACYISPIYYKCVNEYLDMFLRSSGLDMENVLCASIVPPVQDKLVYGIGTSKLARPAERTAISPPKNIAQKILKFMDMKSPDPQCQGVYGENRILADREPAVSKPSELKVPPAMMPPVPYSGYLHKSANFFFLLALIEYWLPDDTTDNWNKMSIDYDV